MARLREIGAERSFELGASTIIGRDPSCTLTVHDPLVSRTHCEIRRGQDDRFIVVDLGSTHGTFVQGERIKDHVLQDGEIVIVGATRFCFELPFKRFGQNAITISTETGQTQALQQVVPVGDASFLPSNEITDETTLRRQYDRLRAAYKVTSEIAEAQDIDAVLNGLVQSAFSLLAADRVAVLLWDPDKAELVPKLMRLRSGDAGAQPVALSKTLLSDVVKNKTGLILVNAPDDVKYGNAQSVVAGGIRSAMTVPMLHAGELLGVMHMDSLMATHVFAEHDLEIFSAVAAQAALFLKTVRLRSKLQEESKTRAYLQRFLSPGVIEEVLGGKYQLGHGGELREITLLFSDIRGFTALSEKHADPTAIVELLNGYFELMVDVLFRHGGTLDKYVGDELMALFGAPVAMPDAPLRAVRCAVDMLAALDTFNAARVAAGKFAIDVGIGIHSGKALCGTIGSRKAMQYTAIGDTVNTAARLCSAAKAGQIIASEATFAGVGGAVGCDVLPPVSVKGKSEPLKIYSVRRG